MANPLIGVRVPKELLERIQRAAKAQDRTVPNYILHVVKQHLEKTNA
jgi:predicted DNA-binding protein